MKRNKIFLGCSAAVASIGAVAPLVTLASCSKKSDEVVETKYDEEYGVDEFTYNSVEQEFKNLVNHKIDNDDQLSDYKKQLEKKMVLSDLDTFRTKINEFASVKSISKSKYTIISNALIDHAQEEYGIRLNRNSKAQWSDIEQMYNGLKNSWKAYLQASGISGDKLASIMSDVETNYKKMTTSLTEKYADPLSALFKAKYELPIVFASVNSDIAYLAASLVLKQFLADYTIEFKQNGTNNKLDQLVNQSTYDEELGKQVTFADGNDITAFMNTAFTIRNAKTGEEVPEGFTRHIIPGYRISPIVTEIFHDEYNNDHGVGISWECVKDSYKIGSDEAKKATVFAISEDNDKTSEYLNSVDEPTLEGIQKVNENDRLTISYSIPLTAEAQIKTLNDTFKTRSSDKDDDTIGDVKLFWDANGENYIDAITLGGEEITPNMGSESNAKYYLCTGKVLAKSGIKIAIGDTTDSTNIYSLNDLYENATRVKDEDQFTSYDVLPTVLKGLSDGCDIIAKVCVETNKEGNNESYSVSVSDSKLAYVNDANNAIDINIASPMNINWKTSKRFWELAIDKYNEVKLLYNQYEDNIYEKDLSELKKEKTMNDVFLGVTIALDSLVMMAALLPTESIGQKVMKFVYLATSAIDMGLEIASYTIFRLHKWNIVSDYAERAKDIKNTTEFKTLKLQLDTDKANHHLIDGVASSVINGPEGKLYIDEDLFDKNYDEYYSIDENYLEVQDNYIHSSYKNPVLQNFRTMLKTNQVDGETYAADMADWDPKTGKWEKISKGLMYASWAVFGAEVILMIFDSTITAAVNAKYLPKLNLIEAEKASRGLFRRVTDTFKKLFTSNKPIDLAKTSKNTKYAYVVAADGLETGKEAEKLLSKAAEQFPDLAKTGQYYMAAGDEAKELGHVGKYASSLDFLEAIQKLPCKLATTSSKLVGDAITNTSIIIKNGLIRLAQKGFTIVYDTTKFTYKFVKISRMGNVLKTLKKVGSIVDTGQKEFPMIFYYKFNAALTQFTEQMRNLAKAIKSGTGGAKEIKANQRAFLAASKASQMTCESIVEVIKNIAKGINPTILDTAEMTCDFIRGFKLT